jgi:hypothetical protein
MLPPSTPLRAHAPASCLAPLSPLWCKTQRNECCLMWSLMGGGAGLLFLTLANQPLPLTHRETHQSLPLTCG